MLTAVEMPETDTGVELDVVVPSPSWPSVFLPQHFADPSVSTAHEWKSPKARLVTVAIPETSTGVEPLQKLEEVLPPRPRRPSDPDPQHFADPSVSTAQEWE